MGIKSGRKKMVLPALLWMAFILSATQAGNPVLESCDSWSSDAFYYNNKCYLFFTDKRTWSSAQSNCQTQGGYLAEPQTSTDMTYIRNKAKGQNLNDGVWIGARRSGDWSNSVTSFSWEQTGSQLSSSIDSQTVNFDNRNNAEDCLELRFTECKVNDYVCGLAIYYLCERDPDTIPLDTLHLVVVPTGGSDVITSQLSLSTSDTATVYVTVEEYMNNDKVRSVEWQTLTKTSSYSYVITSDVQLSAMGIYSDYVKVLSSQTIVVVLYCTTQYNLFSTVILPVTQLSDVYVVVGIPEQKGYANHLSVTAIDGGYTDVLIEFSCRNMTLTLSGFEYRNPSDGSVTLEQYQTVMIQNYGDMTGTVVSANNKLAVFVGRSSSSSHTFTQVLPLTTVASDYVSISQSDTRIQATQRDASLTKVPTGSTVTDRDGYLWDIETTSDVAVVEVDQPSLAIVGPVGTNRVADTACLMPLVPSVLWKSTYDLCLDEPLLTALTTEIILVVADTGQALSDDLRINNQPVSGMAICNRTHFSDSYHVTVCDMSNQPLTCNVLDSNSNRVFMAYVHAYHNTHDFIYEELCYPVQVDASVTNDEYNNLNLTQASEPLHCSYTPMESEVTTTVIPTTEPTTTTSTQPMTTTESPTTAPATANHDKLAAEIREGLEIDYRETSRYRRGKVSVYDKRVSSFAIGLVGLGCCLLVSILILFMDVSKFARCSHKTKRNTARDEDRLVQFSPMK